MTHESFEARVPDGVLAEMKLLPLMATTKVRRVPIRPLTLPRGLTSRSSTGCIAALVDTGTNEARHTAAGAQTASAQHPCSSPYPASGRRYLRFARRGAEAVIALLLGGAVV